jgi:rhodanese-related sulfurtransferase
MSVVQRLTPVAASNLHERDTSIIIDVREASEYAREHVVGARSMPLSTLTSGELLSGKSAVLYCGLGNRSEAAAAQLLAAGVGNVAVIEGGIVAWKAAGLPTEGEE